MNIEALTLDERTRRVAMLEREINLVFSNRKLSRYYMDLLKTVRYKTNNKHTRIHTNTDTLTNTQAHNKTLTQIHMHAHTRAHLHIQLIREHISFMTHFSIYVSSTHIVGHAELNTLQQYFS